MFTTTNIAAVVVITVAASSAAGAHVFLSSTPPVSPRIVNPPGILGATKDFGGGGSVPGAGADSSLLNPGLDIAAFLAPNDDLIATPAFVTPTTPKSASDLPLDPLDVHASFVFRIVHTADGDVAVCSLEKNFNISGAGASDVVGLGATTVPTPSAAGLFGLACAFGSARRRRF